MTQRRQELTGGTPLLSEETLGEIRSAAAREQAGETFVGQPTGNIQDGTATGEQVLSGINFTPQPNPMSELHQPTYHFKFYLVSDDPQVRQENKDAVVIIAETGLTGMNIQDVTIDAIVGPSFNTRNTNGTNVTMKIYEPYGVMLPDMLYQAANRMKIRNYLKAPWRLSLRLHGYDSAGVPTEVGEGWTWDLTLLNIDTQISEVGAVHTITAVPLREMALADQYGRLPVPCQASGETVGDVLKSIVDNLNRNINDQYGATTPPYIEYAIKDMAYPYDTKVGVTRPFDHRIVGPQPQIQNQVSSDGFNEQTGQFAQGTVIAGIVDTLMSRSETAVRQARISRQLPPTSQYADNEEAVAAVSSVLHRVETQVELLDFNDALGDYHKKITFVVKPYDTIRILTSMGRVQSHDREPTLNRRKAEFVLSRNLLKKQYDYLFTGLNTEVEKFDISTNFRWAIAVPVLQRAGLMRTAAQVDNATAIRTLVDRQTTLRGQATSLEEALRESQAEEETSTSLDSDRLRLARQRRTNSITNVLNQNLNEQERNRERLTDLQQAELERSRTPEARQARRPDFTTAQIIEDSVYANAQDEEYGGALLKKPSFLPATINRETNDPSVSVQSGTANDNTQIKNVYGFFLNQLYGSMDANLQSITLEIKGDPYWIGKGDNNVINDEPSTDGRANFMNGEHMFVFRFKLPQGYSPTTGTVDLPEDATGNSNIFTGFYGVIQVKHNFVNGMFTQTLTASRVPGWSYENIVEGRASDGEEPYDPANQPPPAPASSPGSTGSGAGGRQVENPALTNSGDVDERTLLALTLVEEAGGEGARGMQAVGNVILNRANANYKGSTIREVIMWPSQYSCWNNQLPENVLARKQNTATYQQAYRIAGEILSGQSGDITGGARHYHADYVNPNWADPNKATIKIGRHIFYRGIR